jgi:hypothetical protein
MAEYPCCKNCYFADEWDDEVSGLGECHRFPPSMATRLNSDRSHTERPQNGGWPLVHDDDWCGEFKQDPTISPDPK